MQHEYWRVGGWMLGVSAVLGLAAGASVTATLISAVAIAFVTAVGQRLAWGHSNGRR